MTTSGDRFADRFGEAGVRCFATGPVDPALPEAAALARLGGVVTPQQVGPYFHTLPDEPVALREYAGSVGRQLGGAPQAGWARLGSDRAYELCVTPEGEVWAFLLRYDEPLRFVSSTPEAFAEALLQLDLALDAIGATDDPGRAAAVFESLEQQLRQADGRAFADRESWWPLVLDDIRDTAGAESFAAFEFTAQDGERKILTASGGICVHPEERLWSSLSASGVQPEQVTRIHTDLEACYLPGHYCSMWLGLEFPEARLTHSFPYGESAASRADGLRRMREAPPRAPSRADP